MNKKLTRIVFACQNREHRPFWRVLQYRCNYSAFNGYRCTDSDYSTVQCMTEAGGCGRVWRTKAQYVDSLPGAE